MTSIFEKKHIDSCLQVKQVLVDRDVVHSKRRFLRNMLYGSLLTFGVPAVGRAALTRQPSHRALAFQNTHTGEKLQLTYFEQGGYIEQALQEINYVMRDFRTGDVHPIDPALLDQLYELNRLFGVKSPFHIISGYRSPATNAMLRKSSSGVAKKSMHLLGRAIDIRVPVVNTHRLRNAAVAMRQGGVGYYRTSDFVHLDTGPFRTW